MVDAEAAQRKTPVKLASADEIHRVLNAKTDYDCLRVSIQHQSMLSPILCTQNCCVMLTLLCSCVCCTCLHAYAMCSSSSMLPFRSILLYAHVFPMQNHNVQHLQSVKVLCYLPLAVMLYHY